MLINNNTTFYKTSKVVLQLAFSIFFLQVQYVDSKSWLQESTSSFCIDIPGGLRPGKSIKISGILRPNVNWLFINLRSDCTSAEGPLHMIIKSETRTAVKIVLENDVWKVEKSTRTTDFFTDYFWEDVLLLIIAVKTDIYTVSVNGEVLWVFPRIEKYPDATKLEMNGGPVFISKVELFDGDMYATKSEIIYPIPLSTPVKHPTFPFWGKFPHTLNIGNAIVVQGYFPINVDRASINLCGENCYLGPVLLHVDIRFSFQTDGHVRKVVRAYYRMAWGGIESDGPFPFHHKEPFTVTIEVQSDGYHIGVNNKNYWKYGHRLPYTMVETMSIEINYMDIWNVVFLEKLDQAALKELLVEPQVCSV